MAGKLKKLTEEQVTHSCELYKSGESLQAIACRFGVTRQSIWELLRRRIVLRPQLRTGASNHFHRGTKASDWAQNKVEMAIRAGFIQRPENCSNCKCKKVFKDGRSGIQAHHPDYNKPLYVIWLCQKCHHAWHKTNKPIRRVECGLS